MLIFLVPAPRFIYFGHPQAIKPSIYTTFNMFQPIFKSYGIPNYVNASCTTGTLFYSNINSQLDAKITNFIVNYNQLNMFRPIISPILRSTRMCLQLAVQCTGDADSWWQQAASPVHYNASCKHSLVLLRMGEIIARNMLSCLSQ